MWIFSLRRDYQSIIIIEIYSLTVDATNQMLFSKQTLALAIGLARFATAVDPFVQLYIDRTCEDLGDDFEYVLYTFPANTDKCITFGAPGFPFISSDPVTQCGDYTDGGGAWGDCNNYPRNSPALRGGGAAMTCKFWTSEDCGYSGDDVWIDFNIPAEGTGCEDFPIQLPLSGGAKQTASSMTCVLA